VATPTLAVPERTKYKGENPEHRFNFIPANAANLSEDEIDA
jgi:hypothetical protein